MKCYEPVKFEKGNHDVRHHTERFHVHELMLREKKKGSSQAPAALQHLPDLR